MQARQHGVQGKRWSTYAIAYIMRWNLLQMQPGLSAARVLVDCWRQPSLTWAYLNSRIKAVAQALHGASH